MPTLIEYIFLLLIDIETGHATELMNHSKIKFRIFLEYPLKVHCLLSGFTQESSITLPRVNGKHTKVTNNCEAQNSAFNLIQLQNCMA